MTPLGIAILLLGAFLPMRDFFFVNVALPTSDSSLHGSAPMLELVVAGTAPPSPSRSSSVAGSATRSDAGACS
jgi:hypothetical protein